MVYHIYVGTYTNDVHTLAFNPDTRSLSHVSTLTVGHHPSWLTPDPSNPFLVYTALEQSDGRVVAIKFNKDGKGAVVGEQSSLGADPCALQAFGSTLFVGNYSTGNVVSFPISADQSPLASPGKPLVSFTGSGPNKDRQEAAHPHQIIFHPDREELLVPDLGSDKTRRFAKDEHGAWVLRGEVTYDAGGGPRHLAFYKDVVYTLMELTSEVTAHRLPPLPAESTPLAKVSTQRNFPGKPEALGMLAAEILAPAPNSSFPEPYLYATNRNDPSPEGDIIAIFSIADPEKVVSVAEVRSGLKHLRTMVFGGPDNRYLIAGGVLGGGIKIFERVDGGKGLKEIAAIDAEAPTGFLWHKL